MDLLEKARKCFEMIYVHEALIIFEHKASNGPNGISKTQSKSELQTIGLRAIFREMKEILLEGNVGEMWEIAVGNSKFFEMIS
jgi:hypothetical protein